MDLVRLTNAPPTDRQGTIGKLTPIPLPALERALAIVRYLGVHARRVYGALANPGLAPARRLALRISKGELADVIKVWQVVDRGWSELTDAARVTAGMITLSHYGWVQEVVVPRGLVGRPPGSDWLINPLGVGAAV
jgi:hypothetical protein